MLGIVFNFPHPTFGLGHSLTAPSQAPMGQPQVLLKSLHSSVIFLWPLSSKSGPTVCRAQWLTLCFGFSPAAYLLLGLDASESPWLPRVPLPSHFHHLRGEVGHVGFLFPSWGGLPSVGACIQECWDQRVFLRSLEFTQVLFRMYRAFLFLRVCSSAHASLLEFTGSLSEAPTVTYDVMLRKAGSKREARSEG